GPCDLSRSCLANRRSDADCVVQNQRGEFMWATKWQRASAASLMIGFLAAGGGFTRARLAAEQPGKANAPPVVRSAGSGFWSAPATWEGGKIPAAGARVQVRAGHTVTYDLKSARVIRSIHVAGTLTFARDKDTRLDVGLIKVQPGDD